MDSREPIDDDGLVPTERSARDPIDLSSQTQGPWALGWVTRVTAGFVALGVLVRVVRYLLNYPLWCDETMIAANFIDRGFLDLLRPLDYRQVCPLLFLGVELSAVKLFGFSELSLRLFPAACGVASVFLFRHVAGRILAGVPLLLAVAVFAVSGWPLRYVAEVKPYASDLFVALWLLALAVEWWRSPGQTRWLWALAASAPLAVGLSYPAIFIAGGVGIGLAIPVWKSGRRNAWVAYATFNLLAVATFLVLLPFYKTAPQDHAYFHAAWAPAFPPLHSLLRFALWFLNVNTGFMFAYPEGGERGASALTFLFFVVAAYVLWRRGRRTVLVLCLAPFALALVAAALHRYPYGVSARTMQYVAPVICLFAGLGAASLLGRLPSARNRERALRVVLFSLAILGLGRMAFDVSHPYKTPTDQRARAFAEWFWTEQSREAELVCVKQDLGVVFRAEHWKRDATDTYLCYQKLFSPRHRRNEPPRLDAVSENHPLRCVLFNEVPHKKQPEAFRQWMTGMLARYDLRRVDRYDVSSLEAKFGQTWDSLYWVYEFVPRGSGKAPLDIGALDPFAVKR